MSSAIRSALSVFDDAALEALANRGLLRRAARDLETGKVTVVAEDAAAITILADGERVDMTAAGPRTARCSCPATTVCRHKLAAVLLLRNGAGPAESGGSTETAVADPLADVLAVPPDRLRKWAGRANLRAALDILGETAPAIEREGTGLQIRLGTVWPSVMILAGQLGRGEGLDSIISKVAPSRRRALHAAAVLAVWRAQGRDLSDLVETTDGEVEAPPDAAFLATVKATIEAALPTAISQAPETLEEQLFLLSVSSRTDDLPALARRLRQLSGSVRARRHRDYTVQPAQMLSAMASTYALADALASCSNPATVSRLRGAARQGYFPVGTLSMIGLAARVWETRGGARGATGYFYAPEMKRVVHVSLARVGAHDRMFDPASAFRSDVLWQVGPLQQIIGARLGLQGARLSPEGRLSLAQETIGSATAWTVDLEEVRDWSIVFDDWSALQARLQERFAVRLSAKHEGASLIVLLPADQGQPRFDPVRQTTVFPLQDCHGRWLATELPEKLGGSGAFDRLQAITAGGRVEMAIVEMIPAGDVFSPLPLALVVKAAPDASPVHILIDPRLGQPIASVPPRAGTRASEAVSGFATASSARQILVNEIADCLLAGTELGFATIEVERPKRFAAFAARARNAGLSALASGCSALAEARPHDAPGAALRLVHVCNRMTSFERRLPLLEFP